MSYYSKKIDLFKKNDTIKSIGEIMKEKKQNTLLEEIKMGIQREFKQIKLDRQEYLKNSKGSIIKKVPNCLTRIRILGSFFIPPLAFFNPFIAVLTAAIIASTDALDGIIARNFNAYSKHGALLDTIADKLLSLAIVCSLFKVYPFFATSILALETLIVATNTVARISGKETKSSILGKIKTWILSVSSIGAILAMVFPQFSLEASIALIIALIAQTITLIDYNVQYFTSKKEEKQDLKLANMETENQIKEIQKSVDFTKTKEYWKQEKEKYLTKEEKQEKQTLKKM